MSSSNKYYDPKKAHEYYMKNRKLKGRHSTKGMNESQKEMLSYVKYDLKENKRKEKLNASQLTKSEKSAITAGEKKEISSISALSKEQKAIIVANAKAEREKLQNEAQSKIDAIRSRLKNIGKEDKALYDFYKSKIYDAIASIRENTKSNKADVTESSRQERAKISDKAKVDKANVTAKAKDSRNKATSDLKQTKKEIDKKYESKLDKAYKQIKSGKKVSK